MKPIKNLIPLKYILFYSSWTYLMSFLFIFRKWYLCDLEDDGYNNKFEDE